MGTGAGPVDILLTANGPGEVAGWLTPVARRLQRIRSLPGSPLRLYAWVPPCNFASGRELEMVRALGGFDGVFGPRDMWRWLLLGRLPAGYRPARRGLVLFLGGDLFYAAAAARRLGFPAVAYTEGRARWLGTYRRFLVPDARAAERARGMGAPAGAVEIVGDLVVDAVLDATGAAGAGHDATAGQEAPVVGLFAGSRPVEVRWVLPLMLQAAEEISREMGGRVRFLVVRSPFVDGAWLERGLATTAPEIRGAVEVVREDRRRAMARCTVALSVPGTVTAELAVLGVPTVTLLPLHKPELIPLEGLPGLLGAVPGLGPAVKRWVVRRAARRLGPISLPARRAGRPVGPELVGAFGPREVAAAAVALLRDERRRAELSRQLRLAMGPAGAADRVVRRALEQAGLADGAGAA